MGRDLNTIIDDIDMGAYHWVQLLLLGGVMISDGAEILVASSVLTALKDQWHMTGIVRGLMMSTIFVGVFFGGLVGGNIADTYGRRRGILLSYAGICFFGLLTACAQGPASMLFLRFFFGASFGCGMGPGVTLQVETAPSTWRAHVINLGGIFFTFGEVYTSVLLIIFMPDLTDPTGHNWRWVTLLSMIPGFLLLPFAFFLLQESPAFLLGAGRRKEAIESLQYIAHMNNAADKVLDLDSNDPAKRLEFSGQVAICGDAHGGHHVESVERGESAVPETIGAESGEAAGLLDSATDGIRQRGGRGSTSSSSRDPDIPADVPVRRRRRSIEVAQEGWTVLFSPEYRSIVFGGAYLCCLCNYLFYGLTYALPQMFGDLKGTGMTPAVQVLIVSICDLPGVFLAFLLIYSQGISHRASLMWLAFSGAILSLSLMTLETAKGAPQGLYIGLPSAYLLKYVSAALFTLTYVYISEVFPARVRATGVSICISAGRLGSMGAPLIVESLKRKGFFLGEHAPYLMLTSALCAIAIVVVRLCLHFERKNASLVESAPPRSKTKETPASLEAKAMPPSDDEQPAIAG